MEEEKMKENKKEKFNMKEFAKKHGWKIVGGAVLIGGGLFIGHKLGANGKMDIPKDGNFLWAWWPKGEEVKVSDLIDDMKLGGLFEANCLEKPKTDLGVITDLWDEGNGPLFAAEDIKIDDAGKFIKDLAKHLEELDPKYKGNDMVSIAVAGFHTKEA